MYTIGTHVSAYYVYTVDRNILPLSRLQDYCAEYYATFYIVIHYAIFLYAIPHIILKSSPKGEGFYPFHVLGIKISKNCKTAALERS